jgi:hypothetical protein
MLNAHWSTEEVYSLVLGSMLAMQSGVWQIRFSNPSLDHLTAHAVQVYCLRVLPSTRYLQNSMQLCGSNKLEFRWFLFLHPSIPYNACSCGADQTK